MSGHCQGTAGLQKTQRMGANTMHMAGQDQHHTQPKAIHCKHMYTCLCSDYLGIRTLW